MYHLVNENRILTWVPLSLDSLVPMTLLVFIFFENQMNALSNYNLVTGLAGKGAFCHVRRNEYLFP